MIAAASNGRPGFDAADIAWLLDDAHGEIIVLRPSADDPALPLPAAALRPRTRALPAAATVAGAQSVVHVNSEIAISTSVSVLSTANDQPSALVVEDLAPSSRPPEPASAYTNKRGSISAIDKVTPPRPTRVTCD